MNWIPIFAAGLIEGVILGFVLAFIIGWLWPIRSATRAIRSH